MATLLNTLVQTGAGTYDNNVAGAYSSQYVQQQQYYVMTLIKRLLPYLPLWEDVTKTTIPEHSGGFGATNGIINMRKFNSLPVSTTPLVEGVTPDGLNPNVLTVSTSLVQYGDWIKFSDIEATASIDDVVMQYIDLLGENAGRKLHKVIMNSITGGDVSQVFYGGAQTVNTNITNADVLTSTVIKKAVRYLRNGNVPPYPDGFYRAFIHPYQAYDLQNDSLWQDVARYNGGAANNGGMDLLKGEIGKMHGVRFRESTEAPTDTTGAASANTYSGFVYGPGAINVFDFKSQAVSNIDNETGRGMKINVHPVNDPTKDDPMGLFGFVSWKAAFASKVVDPLRICRVWTGSTQ